MVLNKKVAQIFYEIAQLLDLIGDNPFRLRAYERAAMRVESMPEDLEEYVLQDKLEELPGIGRDLAEKIKEVYRTGTLKQYEELKQKVPSGLLEMMSIPGLGPKKIKLIYDKLGITTMEELEKYAREGRLRSLSGFGPKTEENILKGIEFLKRSKGRLPLGQVLPLAIDLRRYIEESGLVKRVDVVGSIRRFKETVHDVDILVVTDSPREIMDRFVRYPEVEEIIAQGEKKSSIIASGVQVDLRVFDEECYGAALLYFTGSKEHNIRVRQVCIERGLKLNEYGLFQGERRVAGASEQEVYSYLGMQWIPPEMREDQGEVEIALQGQLPVLIDLEDIKGDLHIHTVYSDGTDEIETIVKKAISLGYKYVAITDHSPSLAVAKGMTVEKVRRQAEEIARINRRYSKIRVLLGMEVDILADGTLDCPEDVLNCLDVVIAAVHSRFKMGREEMTNRIIKAISHPKVNILAHPTGRLLGERESYEVDMERVMRVAKEKGVAMELNASPRRLDINSEMCRMAKEMGVMVAINTDAHSHQQLDYMRFGVGTARRGWLEKKDVLNTLESDRLMGFLRKER